MRFLIEVVVVAALVLYAWETPFSARFGKSGEAAVEEETSIEKVPSPSFEEPPVVPPVPVATAAATPEKKDNSWMWKTKSMNGPIKK